MARIVGVDIPDRKKIRYSLRYIYGLGPRSVDSILAEAAVDPEKKTQDLTDQELVQLTGVIESSFIVEGALRRQVQQNIQRLRDIRCYRGDRHRRGLPVRGQRTRCNARTRKGKKRTVAGKKGVKG